MEKYGYGKVYRVTDYDHPFDGYKGQDVVIFEEFRSSLKIRDMLNYLDGYPVELPARYANKQVCFHEIYLISNIDLRQQYSWIQETENTTWQAFLRRIHNVRWFTSVGESSTAPTMEYLKDYFITFDSPFDTGKEELI